MKKKSEPNDPLYRLPPFSSEAEVAVLSCIFQNPQECLPECVRRLRDGSVAFYELKHQTIYDVLVEMADKGQTIDMVTVSQRLRDEEMLDMCGGMEWLGTVMDAAPSYANLGDYIAIVESKALLRKMIRTCTEIVSRAFEYQGDTAELLGELERTVLGLRPQQLRDESSKALVLEAIETIEALWGRKGSITGLTTGLPDLDRISDGLHPGEMIVIAAYPSTGKSALAVNIAVTNALAGTPAGIFSLEMKPVQLMIRSICSESRVDLYDVRDGTLPDKAFPRITTAASRLSSAPIFLHDANWFTISQLKAAMRQSFSRNGLKLAVVDYLQIVSDANKDSREQEVTAVSKGAKAIAMELNIPVIVLSQLNDDGKLKESRAIGEVADSVWKLTTEGERQPQVQPVTLVIEKNRNGAIGKVDLTFMKQYTRFESTAKISDEGFTEEQQTRFPDQA